MVEKELILFNAAVAAEVLSALHLPGGATLMARADAFLQKKRHEAAKLLIEEISKGWHDELEWDEHDRPLG